MTSRWLAIYVDRHGKSRAAMIVPRDPSAWPFGINEFELGLEDYDGEPVTLIEMPGNADFRPLVVDVTEDVELPLYFVES